MLSNGLVKNYGLIDIMQISSNFGHKSAIFNLIGLNFSRAHPSLKPHIFFLIKQIWVVFTHLEVVGHGSETLLQVSEKLNYLI